MNKLVKGSIAGAAGIALLLGGTGTLALWNSEAGLDSTSITSGTLTIDALVGASAEYSTGGTVDNDSLIVPGDVITITQDVTIDASGDNLKADLSIDTTGLVLTADPVLTPQELADFVTFTYVALDAAGDTVADLTAINGTDAELIKSVVVTATFAAEDEDAQNLSLNLDNLKVVLTQV